MSEEKLDKDLLKKKEAVKKEASSLIGGLKDFFKVLLDIKKGTDKAGTVQEIKDGISMQGHTAWILIFSIIIASIGLNANSAAVVIGAMLISPLMGPILGVGLSIGINDIDTLKRSLVNFGVMVGLSVGTSFLFFSIPLFHEATTEILARVRPDVRDVFVALAGGLALIIAITRPSAQTNTVAGVAIATALIPPLCAAGYGLATAEFTYFFGAMFLFTINAIFIALATFGIVKYLKFPMVKYIDSVKRKRIAKFASFVAFLILAVSIWQFYLLFLENQFNQKSINFITELRNSGVTVLGDNKTNVNYLKKEITLPLLNSIDDTEKAKWEQRIQEMGLEGVKLNVLQEDNSEILKQVQSLKDLYSKNQNNINVSDQNNREKDDKIRLLESQLSVFYKNKIPFKNISEEAKINYEGLESLSYYKEIKTDFKGFDSINVFKVSWQNSMSDGLKAQKELKLKSWLKKRLALDSLKILRD